MNDRLLVFDCHEAWVYQLRALPFPLDIVVGLRGREIDGWDQKMRPIPPNARLVRLEDVLRTPGPYRCAVAHNLTDLLDAKTLQGPRLLVVHETLDGALREQGSTLRAQQLRDAVAKFARMTGTHVVAVSTPKGRSWGFADDIVPLSADPADYLPWEGDIACGLRVANHIQRRPAILLWDFHNQAFDGLPVTLVGRNDDMPGVHPSTNWQELKETFSRHRFYVHTADPLFEDGYNMATLEAMAAGLPVLGNCHPTSPVEHGVSGFLSNDAAELRAYALLLLADRDLAMRMGKAAQNTVRKRFSSMLFRQNFLRSLEVAVQKWNERPTPVAPVPSPLNLLTVATQL
ncbi:MAG TPA: glycosyltransferase [Candidatus Acidoferrales bacterium]|nr:glycosyltransferase [Candidatus Acidoferrales bacterium]